MHAWRCIQKTNFTQLSSLCDFLELSDEQRSLLFSRPRFPLNLPKRLAQKMVKGTLNDPIILQFLPLQKEQEAHPFFHHDPVGDLHVRCTPKLLQKYHGRALLLASGACAMHCRFCFRQQFPYEHAERSFVQELSTLANDPSIHEIILSGGDPLSLSHEAMSSLLSSLAEIPHIQRIRFHSRFPIGIPERIDQLFLDLLARHPQTIIFILHCNHARELDGDILAALRKIQQLGIPVLSQSVLLKNVNDDEETLLTLCTSLINAGIIPYYLHLLDRVTGSAHFEVPFQRGKELLSYVQKHLSGYGIPRLVQEEAGNASKTFLF
jgi:EF-P beta-lysylation protein EpmB